MTLIPRMQMRWPVSGRALTAALGTGKGTVDLTDWEKTECLIVMGVNAASNAPRMLTSLAEAYRRGAQVVHVNPLIEAASTRTIVPHEILSMATFRATRIDRKSTRLNSSHLARSRMPSSA